MIVTPRHCHDRWSVEKRMRLANDMAKPAKTDATTRQQMRRGYPQSEGSRPIRTQHPGLCYDMRQNTPNTPHGPE